MMTLAEAQLVAESLPKGWELTEWRSGKFVQYGYEKFGRLTRSSQGWTAEVANDDCRMICTHWHDTPQGALNEIKDQLVRRITSTAQLVEVVTGVEV